MTLIFVALVVFIGFYIAHNTGNKNLASNTKTSLTSSKTSPVTTKTTSQTRKTSSQGYFTITQWGVRAPYNGNLTLQYTPPSGSTGIYLSSSQLDNISAQCALTAPDGTPGGYGGYIARFTASAQIPTETGQSSGMSAQQYYANYSGQSGYYMSHVGSYYYIYTHPQGLCASNSATIQNQTDSVFENIANNLQVVPN